MATTGVMEAMAAVMGETGTGNPRTPWGRLRFGGAVLLIGILGACSPAATGSPTTSEPFPVGPSSAAATGSPSAALPPDERLSDVVNILEPGASFTATVTIDGAVVLTSSGRSVADMTEQTVVTSGRTVDYVQVPPQAWARESGAAWVLVAAEQAPASPLEALGAPTTVQLGSDADGVLVLYATYPAAALGLEGLPVSVEVRVEGEQVTFRYAAQTGAHHTESVTVFLPTPNPLPIEAPAA